MNTEKLEKLKKSLDNKFIPDNMKDKIRVEIQKLELEIKTDDTITATEVKEEVKEIEKKVEKALDVAEKKEEQAEAKAPAKTRAKRTTTSRTKKPKVEEKPTTKKKTVFSLAKEIRKADESWNDAKLRARKMMKSETTEIKKKTRTETSKLLASIRRKKELKNLSGTNIKRDINRTALPKGKRISKDGNVYYENRDNRTDRLAPSYKDKIYLADGGGVGKKPTLKKGDNVFVVGRRWFDRVNGNTYHTAEVEVNGKYVGKSRMTYGYGDNYLETAKEILLEKYNFPKGMTERSSLSQLREYGVVLNKSVIDGLKRDLEVGGSLTLTPETPLARGLGISYTGLVGETGAMSSGEMFAGGGQITISEIKRRTSETSPYFFDAKTMKFFNQKMSDFKVRKLENGKYEIYAPRKDYNGKSMGVTKRIFNPETNELEFTKDFATGGGVDKWIGYDKNHLMNMKNGMIVLRGTDLKDIKPKDIKGFDMLDNRGYADGGGVGKIGYFIYEEKSKQPLLKKFNNLESAEKSFKIDNTKKIVLTEISNPLPKHINEIEKGIKLNLKLYGFKKGNYEQGGSLVDGYLTDPNFGDFQAGVYADGGSTGLPAGTEQHFVNYYLGEGTAQGIYAKGGGVEDEMRYSHQIGKYVRAYYNESISNDDNGYQVNLMFYNNEDDDDYFDEEFITTNSPKEAEALADKINEEGYEKFMPKDKFAKGGGVRMVGGREYPTGRNWTNEHKHIDKADIREVNYTRKKSFDDGGGVGSVPKNVQERLEYLRGEIRNESISYGEIAELQSMKEYIDPNDVELLQWADVPEFEDDNYAKGGGVSPFKNMMETNTITEKEINLIKLRMNNDKVDEYTQEAIDFIWDNSPQLTSDQNKKGIDYLRNLWKSPTGKERTNNPFGYREQDALETFEYFELRGFYDAGNRYRKFYVPLYTCVGAETSFEYYISGGGINIVG